MAEAPAVMEMLAVVTVGMASEGARMEAIAAAAAVAILAALLATEVGGLLAAVLAATAAAAALRGATAALAAARSPNVPTSRHRMSSLYHSGLGRSFRSRR